MLSPRQLTALGLIIVAAFSCSPKRTQSTDSQRDGATTLASDWNVAQSGTVEGTSWVFELRKDIEGSTCMRFRVPTMESTSFDRLAAGSSACLRLEQGEHLLNVSTGIVPHTPVAYAYGLVSPEVQSVEATFADGSRLKASVALGTYLLVHAPDARLVSFRAMSGSRTVSRCQFEADDNPC